MPLYADEPEMLTIVLEDALLVGQTINQFIDDWIWNIDSDVRVGGWDKQDNLGRMVYAQVLIDMYLDEVIFAMVYHVRNLDRHGQEEAFARGGEIVAVLEGIFELTKDATQTNLFNAQNDVWAQRIFLAQFTTGIMAFGIILWITILLFANGKLKKLKLINQTAGGTHIDFKLKKIFWLSFGLLSVIAAVTVFINFQANISLVNQYIRIEEHIERYSTINSLHSELNNSRRLRAFMPFHEDEPVHLWAVRDDVLAIQDSIFGLLNYYYALVRHDLDINPEIPRFSIYITMDLIALVEQYDAVTWSIYNAVLELDRQALMNLLAESTEYASMIAIMLSVLAEEESFTRDWHRDVMLVIAARAAWHTTLLAALSIILGAISAWLMSKTISKSIGGERNLDSSTTP